MKEILIAISFLSIEIGDANETATKNQIKNYWLGFESAKYEEVQIAEKKLSVDFPEDYKEFLQISNGFVAPNNIEPSFIKIEEVDYLKNIDPFIIECYNYLPELENSILIAGKDEEQYFLLIPPKNETEKWRYWKFANWYPGEHEYSNLASYFTDVKKFIEKEYQEKE